MSEVKRKSIRYDVNIAPIGEYEIPDWECIKYAKTQECEVTINIPGAAKTISLNGKWQRINLSLRNQEYVATVEFLSNISQKIQKEVMCYVCYDGRLAEGLSPVLIGDITSGQVAKLLAEQAGVDLYWDSRLNYKVVSLINPVKSYVGTFKKCLEELLAPFNQIVRTADVYITKNAVKVLYCQEIGSPYNLKFGDGFWLKSLSITKSQPPRVRNLIVNVYSPRTIDQETKRTVEERYNNKGKIINRIVRYVTSEAGFTLEEKEEHYGKVYYRDANYNLKWKLGMVKRKIVTFEYDPEIDDVNKYFIRSRKLVKKHTEEEIYTNQELTQTNIEDTQYFYEDDFLKQEVTTKSIALPNTPQEAVIYESNTEYSKVSEDIVRISNSEVHWTVVYEYEGGEWKKVSQIAQERADSEKTIMSPQPNIPTLPFAQSEDRIATETIIIEIGNEGEDKEIEFEGECPDLSAIIERITKCKYQVVIEGPGQYDIEAGTDVELSIDEDVCVNKQVEGAEEKEIDLHDILAALPPLRVKNVEITMQKTTEGTELLSRITAEGYGD